ncbi:MAG TPA: VWA domain-containing protein [Pyrinomonadaceae bacterium]|jgi:VWFA-related protein
MPSRRMLSFFIFVFLFCGAALRLDAQETRPAAAAPTPEPSPLQREEQEPLKVFTEEVRLPVVAFDDYGHFDPTLELDDILVLEDGVSQQIRSIRHIPASVLLVLDVDNQITLAKRTDTTRAIAARLLSHLRKGDEAAILQFGNGVNLMQNWTGEFAGIPRLLRTKLYGGKRGRLSEAMVAAAELLKERPQGTRHVVLITDGIETPGGRVAYSDAVRQLIAAQATVHVISYTRLVREAIAQRGRGIFSRGSGRQQDPAIGAANPSMPSEINRSPSYTVMAIDTDRAMRRWYKKYAEGTKANEQRLLALAEETGGQIALPASDEEMLAQGDLVARDIGAQYVVTYTPKRPLSSAKAGEYRRIEVAARKQGLRLRSRRGYIAGAGQ